MNTPTYRGSTMLTIIVYKYPKTLLKTQNKQNNLNQKWHNP